MPISPSVTSASSASIIAGYVMFADPRHTDSSSRNALPASRVRRTSRQPLHRDVERVGHSHEPVDLEGRDVLVEVRGPDDHAFAVRLGEEVGLLVLVRPRMQPAAVERREEAALRLDLLEELPGLVGRAWRSTPRRSRSRPAGR